VTKTASKARTLAGCFCHCAKKKSPTSVCWRAFTPTQTEAGHIIIVRIQRHAHPDLGVEIEERTHEDGWR